MYSNLLNVKNNENSECAKRDLLKDGFNSIAHVGFGIASSMGHPLVGVIFLSYQIYEYHHKRDDLYTDLSEFAIGMLFGELIEKSYGSRSSIK